MKKVESNYRLIRKKITYLDPSNQAPPLHCIHNENKNNENEIK